MNEKRFEVLFYGDVINCVRDETGKEYNLQELISILMEQQATINRLQRKCFELEKDYLIETSDISDKIYLEDEIKELKEKYGVSDDE